MKVSLVVMSLIASLSVFAGKKAKRSVSSIDKLQNNEVALMMSAGNIYCVQRGQENMVRAGERGVVIKSDERISCTNFVKRDTDGPIMTTR